MPACMPACVPACVFVWMLACLLVCALTFIRVSSSSMFRNISLESSLLIFISSSLLNVPKTFLRNKTSAES